MTLSHITISVHTLKYVSFHNASFGNGSDWEINIGEGATSLIASTENNMAVSKRGHVFNKGSHRDT